MHIDPYVKNMLITFNIIQKQNIFKMISQLYSAKVTLPEYVPSGTCSFLNAVTEKSEDFVILTDY